MSRILSKYCQFFSHTRSVRSFSTQTQILYDASTTNQLSSDESSGWKTVLPSGSTLFPECEFFSPVVKPEPRCHWEAIQHSLHSRGISHCYDFNQLADFKSNLESITQKIFTIDSERRTIQTQFTGSEMSESAKCELRRLRTEQKQLKTLFRQFLVRFWKPTLELPNIIHAKCPVGNELYVVESSEPKPTGITISWEQVKKDIHHTPVGTYLTGLLAELEQSQLNLACTRWLNSDAASSSSVSNYPVSLSDFARGPAVESCAWDPMSVVIRLEPSHDDYIQVPSNPSTGSLVRWLVNPHTSCYLVGSASLASFTAFLMRQQFCTRSTLPLRLVSLGSVYNSYPDPTTTQPLDAPFVSQHHQPFQQRKQLSVAELSSSQSLCEQGFFRLVEDVYRFWTTFQPSWPLRLCYVPARELRQCEMLRAVVQVLPVDSNPTAIHSHPITVASVSLLDDWVSRRAGAKLAPSVADFDPSEPFVRMTYVQILDSHSLLTAFRFAGDLSVLSV